MYTFSKINLQFFQKLHMYTFPAAEGRRLLTPTYYYDMGFHIFKNKFATFQKFGIFSKILNIFKTVHMSTFSRKKFAIYTFSKITHVHIFKNKFAIFSKITYVHIFKINFNNFNNFWNLKVRNVKLVGFFYFNCCNIFIP